MTEQERQGIVKILTRRIKKTGFIKLNSLRDIFTQDSISMDLYPSSGLKKWVKEFFPEFAVVGSNGFETLRMSNDKTARAWIILDTELSKNGKLLMSTIPQILSNSSDNINYKTLAIDKRLGEWIEATYPDLKITDDNMWLLRSADFSGGTDHNKIDVSEDAGEKDNYPIQEIQQMHFIAYMNWWSNNVKKLKEFNDTITEENAKQQISRRIAEICLGKRGSLINGMDEEVPKIAFDTGLKKTESAQPIFCILELNPMNSDGSKQVFYQTGFYTIDDGTEMGAWIKTQSEAEKNRGAFPKLEKMADSVCGQVEKLADTMENYLFSLKEGMLPEFSISNEVGEFEKACKELHNLYYMVFNAPYPAGYSVHKIRELASAKNILNVKTIQSMQDFSNVIEKTQVLFASYNLVSEVDSTFIRDKAIIDDNCADVSGATDFDQILSIIQSYKDLRSVMAASRGAVSSVMDRIERVQEHFSELTDRIIARFLIDSPADEIEHLGDLEVIESQIISCRNTFNESTDGGSTIDEIVLPEDIFDAIREKGRNLVAIHNYTVAINGENSIVKMLVFNELEALRNYFKYNPEDSLYSIEGNEELDSGDLPEEFTLIGAAERLYRVIGNYKRIAECYYILSLPFEEKKAFHALLSLYVREKNNEMLLKVFNTYSADIDLTADEYIAYLETLCVSNPAAALAYAHDHCYLMYQTEALDTLLQLPEDVLESEERRLLLKRRDCLINAQNLNEMEEAILADDTAAIKKLVALDDKLSELGYSEEIRERIRKTLAAPNVPSMEINANNSDNDFDIGARFYRYQKNENSVAESFMWKGILNNRNIIATNLLVVLADQGRWGECCKLFETFRKLYSESEPCRTLYMCARINNNPFSAINYLQMNLQECLQFMKTRNFIYDAVTAQQENENEEVASFYRKLCSVSVYLDNPLINSIICLDRSLREYTDSAVVTKLGVADKYATSITNKYRSDMYSHGMDAFSIASRLFELIGTYKSAAEAFAGLAVQDIKTARLLWNIYDEGGDDNLLLSLMRSNTTLKEEKKEKYLDIIFKNEQYGEFISECQNGDTNPARIPQLFIAQLKVASDEKRDQIAMLGTITAESSWYKEWGALLTGTLYECGRTVDLEQIFYYNFNNWLNVFDSETIRKIVTGNGLAAEKTLLEIQQDAVDNECPEIAVYINNVLKIGNLDELSSEIYKEKKKAIEELPLREQWKKLEVLQTLYGDTISNLTGEVSRLRIQMLLNDSNMNLKAKAERIGEILQTLSEQEYGTEIILNCFKETNLLSYRPIYENLIRLAVTDELKIQLVRLMESSDIWADDQDVEQLRSIYQLYYETLKSGIFPEEYISSMRERCIRLVRRDQTVEGLLCLYYLEASEGATNNAKYILRILADCPFDGESENSVKEIKEALNKTWGFTIPGYFELFKNILNDNSIEEINSYLEFVNDITYKGSAAYMDTGSDAEQTRMLSEEESNDLVKKLYCSLNDSVAWKESVKLPIQDSPVAYSKLLFLNAIHNPEVSNVCAVYCEKYEQNDLLLDTLLTWSKADDASVLEKCRKYVESRLVADSDYLKKWENDPKVMDLIKSLCAKYITNQGVHHSIIRALMFICEKSGKPEVLRYFLEVYKKEIYELNVNLGVVLITYLILDERYEEAQEVLSKVKNVLGHMNYRNLVDMLSGKNASELEMWAQNAENRIMLHLILPDGNAPQLEHLVEISDSGIRNGQIRETIHVIEHILTMFPNDHGAYNALFNLCCTAPLEYISQLHRSIRGLVRLRPSKETQLFYRRSQADYAVMLATLDALCIVNNWTERINDYDFSRPTGDYIIGLGIPNNNYKMIYSVSDKRNEVESSFMNRTVQQKKMLTKAYLSSLTGNWLELIEEAWENRIDISFEVNVDTGSSVKGGFIRSLLRILLKLDQDDRMQFLIWIEKCVSAGIKGNTSELSRDIRFVRDFYTNGYFILLEKQTETEALDEILLHPFEDYSLGSRWGRQYIDSMLKNNTDSTLLFSMIYMVSALIKDSLFQGLLVRKGYGFFKDGNDKYAFAFYKAVNLITVFLWVQHQDLSERNNKLTKQEELEDRLRKREIYQAMSRITGLFSDDESTKAKVKKSDFHVWSCLNMVLTLLYSPRSDEISRMSLYFAPKNRLLIEDTLTAFNPSIRDEEKIKLINKRKSDVDKAYFCYAVKYPYPFKNRLSYALTDLDAKEKYNDVYLKIVKNPDNKKDFPKGKLYCHLLVEKKAPSPQAINQKDPMTWNMKAEPVSREEILAYDEKPEYAKGLVPERYEGDINEIIEKYRSMDSLAENIREKANLSRIIYLHQMAVEEPRDVLENSLLRYGKDCYYLALFEKDRENANRILLDIAKVLKYRNLAGEEAEEAERTIQEGLLTLITSFDDLQMLLNFFGKNRILLQFIREKIKDNLVGSCVRQIFSILESLRNCYSSQMQYTQEVIRNELSLNYRRLEDIENNRWMEMKNKVQKLISDEINELDQRPVLQFEVLNIGLQPFYGNIFGEVHNIGKVTAENIVIQATYSDDSSSNQYTLSRLLPDGKAVFELNFSFEHVNQEIEYLISVSFSYSDKIYSSTAYKDVLEIGEISEPNYPIGLLTESANGINFKIDEETGEVYNPEFVGRKNETQILRGLVSGNSFEDYKSALIYGVRRTGKTTLLNYFMTYVDAKCDNVICVSADCQSSSAAVPIQDIFIERVIETIERELPDIKGESRWIEIRQNWGKDYFCADREPEKLSSFYLDVKKAIGIKGIFLVIDEIDRLFEKIEAAQNKYNRNLDSLFGTISGILNSYECRKAVHFLICGSNWLIRYNLKGDIKNQLFQRFGRQVIEVGKLPENDVQELIRLPYRSYPQLIITDKALKWIWDYAGGLVWHTKLLGDYAIERARKDNRFVVYPSDVRQTMPSVITDLWCKQFYEGCELGKERDVVDAAQSLAAKKDAYVHLNQIADVMDMDTVEVEQIINVLIGLRILTRHPINARLYRFELDIYRRYFRTNSSKYNQIPEEPDIFQIKQFVRDSEEGQVENSVMKTKNNEDGSQENQMGGRDIKEDDDDYYL